MVFWFADGTWNVPATLELFCTEVICCLVHYVFPDNRSAKLILLPAIRKR